MHQRVLSACARDRPPNEREAPEAALQVLLGRKASSYDESLQGPSAYQRGNISLPNKAGVCYLMDFLEGEDRLDLGERKSRLRLTGPVLRERQLAEGRARVYCDPAFSSYFFLNVTWTL